MKLLCLSSYVYRDSQTTYQFSEGGEYELEDEFARRVLAGSPPDVFEEVKTEPEKPARKRKGT